MLKGSFFAEFDFSVSVNGFYGDFKSNKFYSVEYFERVEELIADTCKSLKNDDSMVTFQYFNNSSTDLCRLVKNYDGSLSFVYWTRNIYGNVTRTLKTDDIEFKKKNVKQYVLQAVQLFREYALLVEDGESI